ncbi:hypothetical protein CROQUDRAFT_394993 [Cronartium quercuum f. sp. fusiforme G11]|uniref:Erect panicle 2 protein n=1 Tax=Cronartium quercuum f. sp. fusiforme G11 TaxID=708437 RepID=A0A9P6T638_9BASI|nr:hypothetical protein CROQUDRAFT_394993 [Cronartium quercuum f. sp. fusiforme G11]
MFFRVRFSKLSCVFILISSKLTSILGIIETESGSVIGRSSLLPTKIPKRARSKTSSALQRDDTPIPNDNSRRQTHDMFPLPRNSEGSSKGINSSKGDMHQDAAAPDRQERTKWFKPSYFGDEYLDSNTELKMKGGSLHMIPEDGGQPEFDRNAQRSAEHRAKLGANPRQLVGSGRARVPNSDLNGANPHDQEYEIPSREPKPVVTSKSPVGRWKSLAAVTSEGPAIPRPGLLRYSLREPKSEIESVSLRSRWEARDEEAKALQVLKKRPASQATQSLDRKRDTTEEEIN